MNYGTYNEQDWRIERILQPIWLMVDRLITRLVMVQEDLFFISKPSILTIQRIGKFWIWLPETGRQI